MIEGEHKLAYFLCEVAYSVNNILIIFITTDNCVYISSLIYTKEL